MLLRKQTTQITQKQSIQGCGFSDAVLAAANFSTNPGLRPGMTKIHKVETTIVGLFVISSYNYKLSLKLGKVMSKVIFRQKLITL